VGGDVMLGIADAPAPGSGSQLTPGMVGDWYATQLTATGVGGTAGYAWHVVAPGALPEGLTLSQGTGEISGIPLPEAQGTSVVTIQVIDPSSTAVARTFTITINPGLRISPDVRRDSADRIRLNATGGAPPYQWEIAGGNGLPADLRLDRLQGTISLADAADIGNGVSVLVQATDTDGHVADLGMRLKVRRTGWLARRRQLESNVVHVGVRLPIGFRWLRSTTAWLGIIAIWVPLTAVVPILIYAFGYPGEHWKYLAVALLTAIAAETTGVLIGFLFGLPKAATTSQSSPQARYLPSANLPEVSDWLTKLLLGAGLVQLTHLGRPVGSLIDKVASGMYDVGTVPGSAKVLAGAIMFGYTGIGILVGYVMTAIWYLRKLNGQAL